MDLFQRSIDILLANQHSSGAYVACPTFPVYQFCWFRDAAYVAYALDLVAERTAPDAFTAGPRKRSCDTKRQLNRVWTKSATGNCSIR
jgi:GH15 family glucan-1,4-alpha-glucosidase